MSDGFYCDKCQMPFRGPALLKLWGDGNYLDNEMIDIDHEFCESCAKEVVATLRKVMKIKKGAKA